MIKPHIFRVLLPASLLFNAFHLAPAHAEDETQFQKGSEHVVEETEQVDQNGKRVRKIRSGQVRDRQGGPRVGEIEESEVGQVQRRIKSLNFTSFGLGPYFSSNVGNSKMLYGLSVGKHWEVSTQGEILAEFTGAVNGNGGLGNFGLGFSYMPLTTETSPIVGAEFGVGGAKGTNGDGGSVNRFGFSLQGNAGVRMFRLASTQLEVLGTYSVILATNALYIAGVQLRILY